MANSDTEKRVVRGKHTCKHANPLFASWLKEWEAEAAQRNPNMQKLFSRALKSLQKYPLPLYRGQDCMILQHFGEKICTMLDAKLVEYEKENGPVNWLEIIKMEVFRPRAKARQKRKRKASSVQKAAARTSLGPSHCVAKGSVKAKKGKQKYIPAFRSGAYSLLVALQKASTSEDYQGYITKKELITLAQLLCDSSFERAKEGSYYTAWSSMGILIKKGLVTKNGSPGRYALTCEGEQMSQILQQSEGSVESFDKLQCTTSLRRGSAEERATSSARVNQLQRKSPNIEYDSSLRSSTSAVLNTANPASPPQDCLPTGESPDVEVVCLDKDVNSELHGSRHLCNVSPTVLHTLHPGRFKIVLCVDNMEVSGGFSSGQQSHKEMIVKELSSHGTEYSVRKLHVGDFLWIAQEKAYDAEAFEILLPFIVERKRMDDLAASIKDGRFREQKFRLKQLGLTNTVYLVEEYGSLHTSLPQTTCNQAITNTQVIDGFAVKRVSDARESAAYLTLMTRYLQSKFQGETLRAVSYKDWHHLGTKSFSAIYFLPFLEANKLSMKTRQLTVREMFAKHLIQMFGISPEKAAAIVEKFPTPRILMEALEASSHPLNLLSSIKVNRSSRCIGPAVASNICRLYTQKELL